MGYTMDTNGVIMMQSRTVNEKNATDFTPNDFLFHSKQRLRSPRFNKSVVYQYLLFQEDGTLVVGKHCTPQRIPNVTLSFILGLLFRKIPGFVFGEEFVLNNVSDIKGMRSTVSFFQKRI